MALAYLRIDPNLMVFLLGKEKAHQGCPDDKGIMPLGPACVKEEFGAKSCNREWAFRGCNLQPFGCTRASLNAELPALLRELQS